MQRPLQCEPLVFIENITNNLMVRRVRRRVMGDSLRVSKRVVTLGGVPIMAVGTARSLIFEELQV